MKMLFLGGTWDNRVQEVEPLPHIVVPHMEGGWEIGGATFSQHLYTGTRYFAEIDHPCIPYVRVAERWIVYVHGEEPTPDRVLRQLRRHYAPIERFGWRPEPMRGDVPGWTWEVAP